MNALEPVPEPPDPRRHSAAMLAAARARAAPSSNIAQAAWRFGERFPGTLRQWPIRVANGVVMALFVFYIVWLLGNLDPRQLWIGLPFAAACLLSGALLVVSVINSWTSKVTPPREVTGSDVPEVAVLIPTCGEPVPMVLRTILSVLDQRYPTKRLVVVVSDDAHSPELKAAVEGLGVIYHEPPDRWAPGRDGAAKAGNLNSALALVTEQFPEIRYIETRDADDEVGTPGFLRHAVGQLEADERLAFVQTIKETQVSPGDPFVNFEGQFYRGQMLSRNAANAVFPCGSGLVWRRVALDEIGGFPTWNLVEDVQSGVEALRRGWRSCYLPIVGAVGQHSPEDIPNVIKQRGTWAIDCVRLFTWGKVAGLNLRQRIAFSETLLFYLHSFTVLVYVPCAALACVRILPLDRSTFQYLLHLLPFAIAGDLRLLLLHKPFADRRHRQRRPLMSLWRLKVMWIGLAPVYMLACGKALLGGPSRRPVYKVTRKTSQFRWYWKETLPQAFLAALVPLAILVGGITGSLASPATVICAGYWGVLYSAALLGFVAHGWFGSPPVSLGPTIDRRRPRRDPKEAPAHRRRAELSPHPAQPLTVDSSAS